MAQQWLFCSRGFFPAVEWFQYKKHDGVCCWNPNFESADYLRKVNTSPGPQAVLQIFQNLATFQGQTKGWQCIFVLCLHHWNDGDTTKKRRDVYLFCMGTQQSILNISRITGCILCFRPMTLSKRTILWATQGFLVFCLGWICDACHLKSRACHAMAETLRFPNLPPSNFIIATRFTAVFDSTSTGPVSVLKDARMPQSWTSLQTSQDN